MMSASLSIEINENPLVSVIVPAFRHEKYVERCLASIANQSYKNIELVFIDDCSPDKTLTLAETFLRKNADAFSNVIIKKNNINRGAHHSLNRGLHLATGDYITFINSDDTFHQDRIQIIIDQMIRHESGLAFSSCQTIGDDDLPYFDEVLCHQIYWRPFVVRETLPSISWGILWRQLSSSTGNIVLTRELAKKVGDFSNLKYCHDWDYMLRAVLHEEPLFIEQPLYNYRVYGENSFRFLENDADRETRIVLRNYFRRAMTSSPNNKLAPSPENWPTMFVPILKVTGMDWFYNMNYAPYLKEHRTITYSALAN